MQDILLYLGGFLFLFWVFFCGPFIFPFLLCLLSLPSGYSLSGFVVPTSLVISAPSLCIISPSQTLGLLFSISQHHQVYSHTLDCASLQALLTWFSQSWEESVRRSDSPETTSMMWEQCPGMWSGKWLNNRMSHEMQTSWEVWQPLEPQKVVTSMVASCMHRVSVAFTSIVWIRGWFLTDISDGGRSLSSLLSQSLFSCSLVSDKLLNMYNI